MDFQTERMPRSLDDPAFDATPGNFLLAQKGSRPTSGVFATKSSRPASGVFRSQSAGKLQRPWSGTSRASMTSTACRSMTSSASQLTKSGEVKLPPLPKQPLSFDQMYSIAKRKANDKTVEFRKERRNRLPPAVSTSFRLASALKSTDFLKPKDTSIDLRMSRDEMEWASGLLSKTAEAMDQFLPPLVEESWQSEHGQTEQSRPSSRGDDTWQRQGSSRADDPGQGRGSRRGSKTLQRAISTASIATTQSQAEKQIARQRAQAASDAYIQALREMLESGDFRRLDGLSEDVRQIALAGQSGAIGSRLNVDVNGFTEEELGRMKVAFRRFKAIDAPEIHVDDLMAALTFLGYMKVEMAVCRMMSAEITSYTMMDFHEYLSFIEKFAEYEQAEFKREFETFDEDGSGELSFDEVKDLIGSMGVTPLRDTLMEAMSVVDFDGSGQIDFDEFVHLMSIYRVTEGFTRKEVRDLRGLFDRAAVIVPGEAKQVPVNGLGNVMARWFGPQAAPLAQKLSKRFAVGDMASGQVGMDGGHEVHEHDFGGNLGFSEFLLWARRLREAEIKEFHKQFLNADKDGSGKVAKDELKDMLNALGYMPLRDAINEVLVQVDDNGDGELDFEEFVHLMGIYRKTDGFTMAEISELTSTFHAASIKDGEDEIVDCLELIDILRNLGFVTNLDVVRKLIKQVDFDSSDSLDLSEFLRLMRLHRESELQKAKHYFELHKEVRDGTHVLPRNKLRAGVFEVGYEPEKTTLEAALALLFEDGENMQDFDFDDFVCIIDSCRKSLTEKRRKHANYSGEEVKMFLDAFNTFDDDHNGTIERHELTNLLQNLGIPLKDKVQQQQMLQKLDIAREHALAAGVEDHLISPMGSPIVSFYTMLFLLRMLHNDSDRSEVGREAEIMEQTHFNPNEIADFREVFSYWVAKAGELDRVAPSPNARRSLLRKKMTSAALGGLDAGDEASRDKSLEQEGLKRIVRSLGLHLTPQDHDTMEDRLRIIKNEVNFADHGENKYGFLHFLLFMRWMLDTNFASINDVVSPSTENGG